MIKIIKGDLIIEDTIVLDGKEFYANDDIIGINNELEIYEGYDGRLGEYNNNPLTKKQKLELADRMLNLWQQYKTKAYTDVII